MTKDLIIGDFSSGLITNADSPDVGAKAAAILENFSCLNKLGELTRVSLFNKLIDGPSGAYSVKLCKAYSLDKPQSQDLIALIANTANGFYFYVYPEWDAGTSTWLQSWWSSAIASGIVSASGDIHRGALRFIYQLASSIDGKWYGYIDNNWYKNHDGSYGESTKDMEMLPIVHPYHIIDGETRVLLRKTGASDYGLAPDTVFAYKLALVLQDGQICIAKYLGSAMSSGDNAGVKIRIDSPPKGTAGRIADRVKSMILYRAEGTGLSSLGSYRSVANISMSDGRKLDGLEVIHFGATGGTKMTFTDIYAYTDMQDDTWVCLNSMFMLDGTKYGACQVSIRSLGGNQYAAYCELGSVNASGSTFVHILKGHASIGGLSVANISGSSVFVNGDATQLGVGVHTLMWDPNNLYRCSEIAAVDYDGGTNKTELTLYSTDNADQFNGVGSVVFGYGYSWVDVSYAQVGCVILYGWWGVTAPASPDGPLYDRYGTPYSDNNKKCEIDIPYATETPTVEWGLSNIISVPAAQFPTIAHQVPYSLVWLWFTPSDVNKYPTLKIDTCSLRYLWSVSGGEGGIVVWDFSDNSANPLLDDDVNMPGANPGDGDAYGELIKNVGSVNFLGNITQKGENINDAIIYSVWQSAGPALDLYDPLNTVVVGGGSSQKVMAIEELEDRTGDNLVVFKEHEVYKVTIDLANQMRVLAGRIPNAPGILAPKSLLKVPGDLLYLSPLGFIGLNKGDVSYEIRDSIFAISSSYLAQTTSAYDKNAGDAYFLVQDSVASYKLFVFERLKSWHIETFTVNSGDQLILVDHPTGKPIMIYDNQNAGSGTIKVMQLGAAGSTVLPVENAKYRSHRLLEDIDGLTQIRAVLFRGVFNGTNGTVKLYTDGSLSGQWTVSSGSGQKDVILWIAKRDSGTYSSVIGSYHEIEVETLATVAEIDSVGLRYSAPTGLRSKGSGGGQWQGP